MPGLMYPVINVLISAGFFYLASPNYFEPNGYPVFAWIFAVPLFWGLEGKSAAQRLRLGIVFGLTAYSLILSWVVNVNVFLFFFFTGMFALQPVLFSLFVPVKCHPPQTRAFRPGYRGFLCALQRIFLFAALWVCSEALRTLVTGGFAWTIGHSQVFVPELIQIAEMAGSYGVSFVILMVNGCLYLMIRDRWNAPAYLMIGAGLLAAVALYGRSTINREGPSDPYRICTIQPHLSGQEKSDPARVDELVDRQLLMTQECFRDGMPDLVVWPETAVADDIVNDHILNGKIRRFIQEYPVRMLIGSAMLINGENYNSAVLFGKTGMAEEIYHKQHLLPFHEHFPFQEKLGFLEDLFHLKNYRFYGGRGSAVLPAGDSPGSGVFGTAICSEEGYPQVFRDAVLKQAGFFVVMLNDAWFESDAAMMMHAQNGFMQAAAFKVPVVRSSNSGLSGAIDRYGRMQGLNEGGLGLNQQAVFSLVIYPGPSVTVYAQYGNIFVFLCGFFSGMILWKKTRKRDG